MITEDKETLDFYQRCIDVWGKDAQVMMCIEEMSELTKELCKYFRPDIKLTDERREHICEEIADVINMASQLRIMFGKEKVDKFIIEKIERTKKLLDKIESEG